MKTHSTKKKKKKKNKKNKHQDIKQKEPPQKYRLGTISNTKLLAGLNQFYRRQTLHQIFETYIRNLEIHFCLYVTNFIGLL